MKGQFSKSYFSDAFDPSQNLKSNFVHWFFRGGGKLSINRKIIMTWNFKSNTRIKFLICFNAAVTSAAMEKLIASFWFQFEAAPKIISDSKSPLDTFTIKAEKILFDKFFRSNWGRNYFRYVSVGLFNVTLMASEKKSVEDFEASFDWTSVSYFLICQELDGTLFCN